MIVITGANGQLGQLILQGLLKKVPTTEIVAGCETRQGQRFDGARHTGTQGRL